MALVCRPARPRYTVGLNGRAGCGAALRTPIMTTLPLPSSLDAGGGSRITAHLGPTNTGKTHRAIERMIAHGGGMIGLPLRLLAREVYDRVCGAVGVREVALITGEERIEPHRPRFWVCTVESMPLTEAVPFLAVDEIQLATHPERGHVFTDRLLNARGTKETWFLGSDTMRPIVERLVPTAVIETHERLSALHWAEPKSLASLPPRSAVIAFSVADVYELADQVRAARGGVAVVLGALSPRARNAQVAMFESGEVQHLVSTDAIGMGLNLDLRYVYFSALRKFDGQTMRELEPWEIGQIAGRAGRHKREGHFGLTRECAETTRVSPRLIAAVERQHFHPVRKIYYRNENLDLSSVDALRHSLRRPPFASCLVMSPELRDARAFELLMRMPEVADAVQRSPDRLALLWDVCRIPDFRDDSEGAHIRLLAQIFRQLVGNYERISTDWMEERLRTLDSVEGDIDAMTRRIANTRTLAYIAHRKGWHGDAERWKERVVKLEEDLSAALHQRLTAHFVDERVAVQVERSVPHGVKLEGEEVVTKTVPLGRMESFGFVPSFDAQRLFGPREVRRHGRAVCVEPAATLAAELLAEGEEGLRWGDDLRVTWRGQGVAELGRGRRLDAPELQFAPMGLLSDEVRLAVRELAQRWVRARIAEVGQVLAGEGLAGPAAGILYVLRSALGVVPRAEVEAQIAELDEEGRRQLAQRTVRLGVSWVYTQKLFRPAFEATRAACLAAWFDLDAAPPLPGATVAPTLDQDDAFVAAFGYPRLGGRCVRADMVERITAHLRKTIRRGPVAVPEEPMNWLGCTRIEWLEILEALGYRVRAEGVFPPRRAHQGRSSAGQRR